MKNFMKTMAMILSIVMIMTCFGAIGYADSDKVTLTLMYTSAGWEEANDAIIAAFEEKYPNVTVDYLPVADEDRTTMIQAKIAADELPDVVAVDANEACAELAEQGWLGDLSDTPVGQDLIEACKSSFTSPSGITYGIPYGNATCFIYYNKAMFEEAGITALPTNWEEFLAVCETLKSAGITPCIMASSDCGNELYSFSFAQNVVANDADWQAKIKDGSFNFESDEVVAMMKQWEELKPYMQDAAESTDYGTAQSLFAQGKGAMKFGGSWEAAQLDDEATNGFSAGTFAFCFNKAGEERTYAVSPESGLGINAKSENIEYAKLFVDFMLNERYDILQNARGSIPHIKNVSEACTLPDCMSDTWNEMSQFPKSGLLHFVFMPGALSDGSAVANAWQSIYMGVATPEQAAAGLQQAYLAAIAG